MSFKKSQNYMQFSSSLTLFDSWLFIDCEKGEKNEKRQSSLMHLNGCNNLLLIRPNLSVFSLSFILHTLHHSDDISQHTVICRTSKRREKFFCLLLKFRPHKIVSRDFSYQSQLFAGFRRDIINTCMSVNLLSSPGKIYIF
jgi:hypothetical protein